MRKALALLAGLAVLVLANLSIYQRERLLAEGQVVLLELAPVDPRSLMQGDYMALDFQISREMTQRVPVRRLQDGHAVLALDDRQVGTFVRFDESHGNSPLAPHQVRLRYRVRHERVRLATNAFFFQEGEGKRYATARYGEFRVDSQGEAILTGLRDGQLAELGPVQQP